MEDLVLQWALIGALAAMAAGWILRPDSGEWFD